MAEAEAAVSEARLALQVGQDELDVLLNPDSQTVAQAEAAVADAKLALQAMQEELNSLLSPDSQLVAEAEKAVVEATIAVQEAQEVIKGDLLAALSDVNTATKDLEAARQDVKLTTAANADDMKNAREDVDDVRQDYIDVHKKWTGIELTDKEAAQSPQSLFESWGLDLETVFSRPYYLETCAFFFGDPITDDPATRWHEPIIYAWLVLYPEGYLLEPTCEGEEESSSAELIAT